MESEGRVCTYPRARKAFSGGGAGPEGGSDTHSLVLGMYFAPSGFLSPNKDGSDHFKKDFSYN